MDYLFNVSWRWEDMCGPAGLQPWDNKTQDVGPCFCELFLEIPVYFLIAVVSGFYMGLRQDWVIREKTQERAIVLRSLTVLVLVFIPIVKMYMYITEDSLKLYPVDYFVAGAKCLAWLVHFGYILALKHRLGSSARGPFIQLLLWGASVTLTVVTLRSDIMKNTSDTFDIASLCCHGVYLLTLLPSSNSRRTYYSDCLVGSQHTHNNEYTRLLQNMDEDILGTAEQDASCCAMLTFSWLEPLFQKGAENKLTDADQLFDLPVKYNCAYVGARLDRALVGNVDLFPQETIPHEPFITTEYGRGRGYGYGSAGGRVPRRRRRYHVSLLRALHSTLGVAFYGVGLLRLVSDGAGFAGPLLLGRLLTFLQDADADQRIGYMYALGFLSFALTAALANSQFTYRMGVVGLRMRGAIVSVVLRKVLAVREGELRGTHTQGELTNLMSTDADRIVNACPSFHALWSIPLQLVVTIWLLFRETGLSFLPGLGFCVLLLPVNRLLATRIGTLSTRLMEHKDKRVSLVAELLRGILPVKVHVWEDYFLDRVAEARRCELKALRGRKYLDAWCVVLWSVTPAVIAALTLGTHAVRRLPLTASMVFTTVALVNMLIMPLNAFPWVLNGLTEAWVSLKRIQRLLELPDMDPESYYEKLDTNRDEDKLLVMDKATFAWDQLSTAQRPDHKNKGKSSKRLTERRAVSEPFMLKEITVQVPRGCLVGVGGAVGSGKSSLLLAILGEMRRLSGTIAVPSSLDGVAYVGQRPWLQRGTIRDNVTAGAGGRYDDVRYRHALDVCALTEDVQTLGGSGAGVGEEGGALSGGQRARVALARAVYLQQQVYLLDDVLAALDDHVAAEVMRRCVLGALADTTRVLVTHSPRHLARCDHVLILQDGRILTQGPPETVLPHVEHLLPESPPPEHAAPAPATAPAPSTPALPADDTHSVDSLDAAETWSRGSVSWSVLGLYLRAVGVTLSVAILLSLVVMQLSQNVTFLWLAFWLKNAPSNTTTITQGAQDNSYYLEVYFGLTGLSVLLAALRAFLFAYGGVRAARVLHRKLLSAVLHARMKFFESTPAGRIVNRFSSDTYTVDDSLPFILNILLAQLFSLIGSVVVTLWGLPGCALVLVPLLVVYWWLQRRYRVLSRHLKRLQSVALSPLYAHFGDTLQGAVVVRARGAPGREVWSARGEDAAEVWQRAALNACAAQSWLSLRLQAAAALLTSGAALVATLQRHSADPGLVGLAISYVLTLTGAVSGALNAATETERELIAVERQAEYINNTEQEPTDGEPPPYGWPSQGVIEFDDVHLQYRGGTDAGLRGVSFVSGAGEWVGVAGRTGAGKSSLLSALLRLHPVTAGHVRVDNVDVSSLHLTALRSRIGLIPQEPWVFAGSVRDNVDPLRAHTDEDVSRALTRCGARSDLAQPATQLSRGEQQLLCVARTMLHRPKVVLIDEATASLDAESEHTLLEGVSKGFASSTALVVSHRAAALRLCRRVVVLRGGRVAALDTTDRLLHDPHSPLSRLLRTGDLSE